MRIHYRPTDDGPLACVPSLPIAGVLAVIDTRPTLDGVTCAECLEAGRPPAPRVYQLVSLAAADHRVKVHARDCHRLTASYSDPDRPCQCPTVTCSDRRCVCRARGVRWPAWGSALVVPPPPDYSTHEAVTRRIREVCGPDEIRAAGNDKTFRQLYRELRAVVPAAACRVEDTHRPPPPTAAAPVKRARKARVTV